MNTQSKLVIAISTALLLSHLQGCKSNGGTSPSTNTSTAITAVKVAGDSLADSGTFGYKFTVQGSTPTGTGSTPIWPELVASNLNNSTLCNYYQATSKTAFINTSPNCGNYAVAGARINMAGAGMLQALSAGITDPATLQATASMLAASPFSIDIQLKNMAVSGFAGQQVVLVDGGGNDAADLITAYLFAQYGNPATTPATPASPLLLNSLFSTLGVSASTDSNADATAYMQKLANSLTESIKANTQAKGSYRVVVLNMPSVTNTPRLKTVLNGIASTTKQVAIAKGATEADATQLASSTQTKLTQQFEAWINAYNTQLATNLSGDNHYILVDFATAFTQQIKDPAQFQLTNVTDPVCPAITTTAAGPEYDLKTCTASYLVNKEHWAFSDNFHPTPYGHTLIANLIALKLAQAKLL